MSLIYFALFSFLNPTGLWAAPYPATATSALVAPEKALFLAVHGVRLNAGSTNWFIGDELRFENPTQRESSLSVKIEDLVMPTSLEIYTKKWMKEYISYGFEVLGNKNFTQGDAKGLVIDLKHSQKSKQLRQAIFVKDQKAVILTCVSSQGLFSNALKDCNEIIRSFAWIPKAQN